MSSPYRSVGETAAILGVSEKTVYSWVAKGILPGAFKIGGRWFIDKEMMLKELKGRATLPKRNPRPSEDRHGLL